MYVPWRAGGGEANNSWGGGGGAITRDGHLARARRVKLELPGIQPTRLGM